MQYRHIPLCPPPPHVPRSHRGSHPQTPRRRAARRGRASSNTNALTTGARSRRLAPLYRALSPEGRHTLERAIAVATAQALGAAPRGSSPAATAARSDARQRASTLSATSCGHSLPLTGRPSPRSAVPRVHPCPYPHCQWLQPRPTARPNNYTINPAVRLPLALERGEGSGG